MYINAYLTTNCIYTKRYRIIEAFPCIYVYIKMRVKKEKPQQPKHVTITPFREKVYEYVKTIPKGKVSTYGDVAKSVNSCARAVGQAMRHNPFAPEVP